MTAPARRDAHRPLCGPASPWDNVAYQRWLSGVDVETVMAEGARRRQRMAALVSVSLALVSLAVAYLTGVLALYVDVLRHLAELVTP